MTFDGSSFLASLVVGSIGFVLFVYGKRMTRAPQMIAGLLLLIGPYFLDSALSIGLSAALVLGLFLAALRLGY